MIKRTAILAVALSAILLTGCETKTGTGALAGGALGAGAGALIGGGQGALIGGAVGAIGGGLVGAALDSQDRKQLNRQNPNTLNRVDRGEQLSVNDIISLHKSGISDRKIMDLIDNTNSHYRLNSYQINRLENAGVSQRVINHMIST